MLVYIDMTSYSVITRITVIIVTILIFTTYLFIYIHNSQALCFLNVAKDARIEPPVPEFFLFCIHPSYVNCLGFGVLGCSILAN